MPDTHIAKQRIIIGKLGFFNIMTVSYTHLDVYKRQIPMYPYNQKCLKELKYSLTRQIWNRYTSVSYTHLDVYKRQRVSYRPICEGMKMARLSASPFFTCYKLYI